MKTKVSVASVLLMVTGTTVGGGVLALPILAGESGFWPSMAVCTLAGVMMAASGWLMAEEYLSSGSQGLSLIYEKSFGKIGKRGFVAIYLALFGCLLTAYLDGLNNVLCLATGWPKWVGMWTVWGVFVALMSGKVRSLFIGNNLLVLSMCLAFGLLLAFCIPHIDIHRLSRVGGTSSYCSLFSLFLGSFGFHGSIPVFCQNLNGHRPSVHRAILGGTLLSGTLYFLFLVSTLGSLPITGETASLEFARIQDVPVTLALGQLMEHQYLFNFLGYAVSVLAIATSLLGVGEGMAQFLKDECPKISLRQGRYIALLIPLLGGSFAPHIFVRGLVWMGVGCEFLFGIVPSLIGIKRFRSQRWGRISMGLFLGFLVALFIELIHLYRSP